MDVKNSFWHGELDDMIVMAQPQSYMDLEKLIMVVLLRSPYMDLSNLLDDNT